MAVGRNDTLIFIFISTDIIKNMLKKSVNLKIKNGWPYITCIFTMYYYMSLCNISLLTSSLEPLHGFASNFVWMFLRWTPTKFVKIGVLPLFFME